MWIKDVRDYIIYEDKEILVCHKPVGSLCRVQVWEIWIWRAC